MNIVIFDDAETTGVTDGKRHEISRLSTVCSCLITVTSHLGITLHANNVLKAISYSETCKYNLLVCWGSIEAYSAIINVLIADTIARAIL